MNACWFEDLRCAQVLGCFHRSTSVNVYAEACNTLQVLPNRLLLSDKWSGHVHGCHVCQCTSSSNPFQFRRPFWVLQGQQEAEVRFVHPMRPAQLGGVHMPIAALQFNPQRTHDLTRYHVPAAPMPPWLHEHCTV